MLFVYFLLFAHFCVVLATETPYEIEIEEPNEIESLHQWEECKNELPIEICSLYHKYCDKEGFHDFLTQYCRLTCERCNYKSFNRTSATDGPTDAEGLNIPQCGRRKMRWKRIVGGTNAALGAWPWQVNIEHRHNLKKPGHYCGGSLLNDRWVVSAAHCFHHDANRENFWVRLGEVNLDNPGNHVQAVKIKKLILHPRYDNITYDNDIALLKLQRKVTFNRYISPICLPPPGLSFSKGKRCHITGWGNVKEYKNGPKILQQAPIKPISQKRCVKKFRKFEIELSRGMICTGSKRKRRPKDSCYGDSGGPLVCTTKKNKNRWYLFGIISWGIGCGRKEFFGVQTNVRYYSRWIQIQLKRH